MVVEGRSARLTVASFNIRGIPVTGSRLKARCQAIGDAFESSDADVVCLQEVLTYGHLRLLTQRTPSFGMISYRRSLAGPAGGVVTLARQPAVSRYRRFPVRPLAGLPLQAVAFSALKGMLVTRLADGTCLVNVHLTANSDGDWSPGNRFAARHRRQLAAVAELARGLAAHSPVIVAGDFNVARASGLWREFMAACGLSDAFGGQCPPTFHGEYLAPGHAAQCVDFILVSDRVLASGPRVILDSPHPLPGGDGYLSDHVGLSARIEVSSG
jgi:endonuclease/exonuclease/phosphatase family metal-dependent hydrolase